MGGSGDVVSMCYASYIVGSTADGGDHDGIEVWDFIYFRIYSLDSRGTSVISSAIIVVCGNGEFPRLV